MPSISMNESANYVTQSGTYDRLVIGKKLTNRTIAKRQKQGWFGTGMIIRDAVKKKVIRPKYRTILSDYL